MNESLTKITAWKVYLRGHPTDGDREYIDLGERARGQANVRQSDLYEYEK